MKANYSSRGSERGFTIVETMIVLAVAGLILVIVFYAIPTLQRNGRNNQRQQDVAAVMESVSQYQLNNSGTFPSGTTFDALLNKIKLSYYQKSNISSTVKNPGDASVSNDTNAETVKVFNRNKCDTITIGSPTQNGAGFSDIVVLFHTEGSSNPTPKCLEL